MSGPKWTIPPGAVAKVSIVDSTMRLSGLPTAMMFANPVEGFEHFEDCPTWCLLVESPTAGAARRPSSTWARRPISAPTRPHQHLDHIGNPNTFPKSTEIVVGQGFTKAYCPGYPANPDSPVCEAYFADRTLREINFEPGPTANLQIGGFRAHDFFGDGSFYLLDTPGHTSGHLSALARTTSGGGSEGKEDTFIMMGGDLCHHGGELRPSSHMPLPDPLTKDHYPVPASLLPMCPGAALFGKLNTSRGRRATDEVFVDPADFNEDPAATVRTIREAQIPDAMDSVFFVFAHDATLQGVIDVFPKPANDWKRKGWAEKVHWRFLKDFAPAAAKFAEAT
ncbi:hypothetical protein PG988_016173 [Apiospora saccharicola]